MNKPAKVWRAKGVDLAAWQGQNGYTFTIRKTYKDKNTDQWKETKTLFPSDLDLLVNAIGEAKAWCRGEIQEAQEAAVVPQSPAVELTDDDKIPF